MCDELERRRKKEGEEEEEQKDDDDLLTLFFFFTLPFPNFKVRRLNWTAATGLKGVLHSKFMIIDQSSAYIGSANFDWRSLSQVKELGIVISNCSALTNDVMLLFEQHWALALPNATVPNQWDVKYWPEYNSNSPLLMQVKYLFKNKKKKNRLPICLQVDNQKVAGFVAVSPPSLCPPTRTSDTDAILDMFRNANRFARLAVMEYSNFFRKLVWVCGLFVQPLKFQKCTKSQLQFGLVWTMRCDWLR